MFTQASSPRLVTPISKEAFAPASRSVDASQPFTRNRFDFLANMEATRFGHTRRLSLLN